MKYLMKYLGNSKSYSDGSEINWDSWGLVKHIYDTYDVTALKVTLRLFSALVPCPITLKHLAVEQNRLKVGTSGATCSTYMRVPFWVIQCSHLVSKNIGAVYNCYLLQAISRVPRFLDLLLNFKCQNEK